MSGSGPDSEIPDFFPRGVRRGMVDANLIARRLEGIVRDMGTGTETLYRRAREAVLRGEHELLLSDRASNDEVLRHLLRFNPPVRRGLDPARAETSRNPSEVHRWWTRLSDAEKEQAFRDDPFIGNTDGIPQRERNIYNRRNLREMWEQAYLAKDRDRAAHFDDLKELLHGGPYLLSHLDRDGLCVLSRGNPDLSDNSVVFLNPALNPDLNIVDLAADTMQQIRQMAHLADPGAMTSVTFWCNYKNPGSMLETMFPQYAADGAAAVRSYHEGLRVTHHGPPAHTTTFGHSYGGVLAGHAAGHGNELEADELVLLGNRGIGVNDVSKLRLGGVEPGRIGNKVHAAMAPYDPLRFMPDTHGPMPTDPEFNASTIATSSAPGVKGWSLLDHAADNYLSSTNPAAQDIGLIITGHGDRVSRI